MFHMVTNKRIYYGFACLLQLDFVKYQTLLFKLVESKYVFQSLKIGSFRLNTRLLLLWRYATFSETSWKMVDESCTQINAQIFLPGQAALLRYPSVGGCWYYGIGS